MTETTTSSQRTPLSFWGFIQAEFTRDYMLECEEQKYLEKRERIYNFLLMSSSLEKFMLYGFCQCLDTFLYVWTFLPMRITLALMQAIGTLCRFRTSKPNRLFEPAQIIDMVKGLVVLGCAAPMCFMDISVVYHTVRAQAAIKLYMFFNMLEVCDRLLSSFGQDTLDAVYWTATEPRRKHSAWKLLLWLIIAITYCTIHAILVLLQAITLNVAFNSQNKMLLIIMLTNNFIELKHSVFKKFDRNNLFQLSCSDCRERFHYVILLFVVCVRNLDQFNWDMSQFWPLIDFIVVVFVVEFFVDWVKHGFILKFNELSSEVYREYILSLALDMVKTKQDIALSDYTDLLSRRLGFIPLPFACLIFGVLFQTINVKTVLAFMNVLLAFLCLFATKLAVGTILLGVSCEYITNNRKETITSAAPIKEQMANTNVTTSDQSTAETTAIITQPIEKTHTRSMSLVHLNKLISKQELCQPSTLPSVDGGDELNETSFRDADDNYQCLTNDQNCPPVLIFSKASTSNMSNIENINNNNSSTITTNTDEGIVFTAQSSTPNRKQDLNDVQRYKMCGNSIII
ncbi:unnamed protein product [Rotaria socialis]|uniref:Uncharacterized protein n=2 Tax=Rotaria socialis TaxID=392032 RepID=A0A820T5T3_9BILA|nr:unnamed protein product [Rotaria socialis]CAF3187940.1 unnamed protein product [Rotaria socialis]CAF3364734.1 unnamed protein product [Rotaria socialis]CAF3385363.1 unnamed protein product [Rotaria socialis]CAF4210432.1 unnamed protein product [Rotaria socialis]